MYPSAHRFARVAAYDWKRVRYCSFTGTTVRTVEIAEASLAAMRALMRLGRAIAEMMAMIATTSINSTRVNPPADPGDRGVSDIPLPFSGPGGTNAVDPLTKSSTPRRPRPLARDPESFYGT